MSDLIKTLASTPLPTLLVLAGLFFLFLAIGGQFGADKITTDKIKKRLAGIIGCGLLLCGLILYLGPGKTDSKSFQVLSPEKGPQVVATIPQNGDTSVDPLLGRIEVTFNRAMKGDSWSWVAEKGIAIPDTAGEPSFLNNNIQALLPVKLEPDTEYVIWINSDTHSNFKDKNGNKAQPFRLHFKTK
jgi:hypothetical protein